MLHADKTETLNQGVIIFAFLAVLTVLEFFIAITMGSVLLLVVIALVKAGLVGYYYMHIFASTTKMKARMNRMLTKPAPTALDCGFSCFRTALSSPGWQLRVSTYWASRART
jgi:cytochrome c oxidase subunit 4